MNSWWNFDFATSVFERPILETKWWNCAAIVSLILHVELLTLLTHLPFSGSYCRTIARPRLLKKSLPMIILWPSSTIVRRASLQVQLFYVTVVSICPRTLIGLFEKVFNSLLSFVENHFADGVVRSIRFASVFQMRLTTLPESIIAFACTSPNWIFNLRVQVDLPNRKRWPPHSYQSRYHNWSHRLVCIAVDS